MILLRQGESSSEGQPEICSAFRLCFPEAITLNQVFSGRSCQRISWAAAAAAAVGKFGIVT
jgi:hypothetical protein